MRLPPIVRLSMFDPDPLDHQSRNSLRRCPRTRVFHCAPVVSPVQAVRLLHWARVVFALTPPNPLYAIHLQNHDAGEMGRVAVDGVHDSSSGDAQPSQELDEQRA